MPNLVERPVDTELLSAYLDGALTTEQRRDVEAQVAASAAWRDEMDSLRWTLEILRQTPDVALPRSFEIPIPVAADEVASREESRRPWWANTAWLYGLTRGAAAVSVALLIAVIGLDAWQTTRGGAQAIPMSATAVDALAPAPPAAAEARKAPVEAPKAAAQAPAPAVQSIPVAPSPFPPGSSAPSGAGGGGAGAGAGDDTSAAPPAGAPVVRPSATTAAPAAAAAEAAPVSLPTAAPQVEARSAPVATAQLAVAPRAGPAPPPQPGNPYRAAEIGLAVLAAVLAVSAIVLRALTRR